MKVSEFAYGGLWCASAVYVAGYTWSALTGEYSEFPTINTAGKQSNQPAGILSSLPFGDFGYNFLKNAQSAIGQAFSSGPDTPAQRAAKAGTHHADPRNYAK